MWPTWNANMYRRKTSEGVDGLVNIRVRFLKQQSLPLGLSSYLSIDAPTIYVPGEAKEEAKKRQDGTLGGMMYYG